VSIGDTAIGLIRRFLTFLAKMGLSVRDDPKKAVDIAGRSWGESVGGVALSVWHKPDEGSDGLTTVSVAIHNRGAAPLRLVTRGWLYFFQIAVTGADGSVAGMTPYGRELMKPERQPPAAEVVLGPGEAAEADIPIGSIFQLRKGRCRVQASCDSPGGRVVSNEIAIGV
jgi:hypothetical protein